jgi:hypothetical protein
MTRVLFVVAAIALAACSKNPAPSTSAGICAGNRVLTVTNGGDEAVNVYAVNGRTTTEIGTVPQGTKQITVPSNVRATSFYAVAISQLMGGSHVSATTDTRVKFVEECRPK